MADEENIVFFSEKQEILAEEERSARLVDNAPITMLLPYIPFLFLVEGVTSIVLGFAIWLIFLNHRESLPLYKWIASLGCSIHGTNGDRAPVIAFTLNQWCFLSSVISSFGWEHSVFSITPFLPTTVITVINTVGFVDSLVLLILVLPYIGGITLHHHISVADRLPNSYLAVTAACFCEVIGCLLVLFVCYYLRSDVHMSTMANALVGSAVYITMITILIWFARSSGSQTRKILDTTFMAGGLVSLVGGAVIYFSPDGIQFLHEFESAFFLQSLAMT